MECPGRIRLVPRRIRFCALGTPRFNAQEMPVSMRVHCIGTDVSAWFSCHAACFLPHPLEGRMEQDWSDCSTHCGWIHEAEVMSTPRLTRTLRNLLQDIVDPQTGRRHCWDDLLRGLDDDLDLIDQAIAPEVAPTHEAQAEGAPLDPALASQYAWLEAAITGQGASPARLNGSPSASQRNSASLRLGAWLLEDDCWTLMLGDGGFALALTEGERAVLRAIALTPNLKLDEMAFLNAIQPHASSAKHGAKLVRQLRSRVRAYGLSLPVLRQRDGGYSVVQRGALQRFRVVREEPGS